MEEKIIITMTSWKKRIDNVKTVLESILKQTKKPDMIILNLSSSEFVGKENELPESLLTFIDKNNDLISINWIDGVNSRQWKKTIPTMLKYPNDCVICIDDDKTYGSKFIESLYKFHLKHPDNPATTNSGYKIYGKYLQHCGQGTLDMAKFYNNFEGIDFNELYKMASSDTFFTYLANKNNHPLLYCGSDGNMKNFNAVAPLSKSEKTCNVSSHKEMWSYLEKKYGRVKTNTTTKTINNPFVTSSTVKHSTIKKEIKPSRPRIKAKRSSLLKVISY